MDSDIGQGSGSTWQVSERKCDRMGQLYATRRTETLEYIQEMLEQLCMLARRQDCEMLGYLIEMAVMETSDLLRGTDENPIGAKSSETDLQK